MPKQGVHGPRAFFVTLGIVVVLLGAMVFLALPAADRMDAKQLEQTGVRKVPPRRTAVVRASCVGLATGVTLVLVGLATGRKRQPS